MLRLLLVALITLNILFAFYVVFIDKGSVTNDRTGQQVAASKITFISPNKAAVK